VSAVRHLWVVAVLACAASLSCKVNDYCLNCENGDGGTGDGGNDGPGDGGGDGGGGDAGQCIVTGAEVCDNKDNDCDGVVDNGVLPEVGDDCPEQRGECAGGKKLCVNGAIVCSKNPKPEQCNLKDDDCDGTIDNGDPSDTVHTSGVKCGTNAGECTAGTFHCNPTTGTVTCGLNCGTAQAVDCPIGGENPPFGTGTDATCNAKDDNCNGAFDEDVPPGGPCGGGISNAPPSICVRGTFKCSAGATICDGSVEPQAVELCDNLDNDCDGDVDEDFNFATDPFNCGGCNQVCNLPNAFEGCADPDGGSPTNAVCTILACQPGFHNNDGQTATGCEFGPCTITGTVEVCNGVDDDCNPATGPNPGNETNLVAPAGFCLTQGACAGAVATCQGALGFRCNYNGNVSQDANGNVVPETLCDGIDNDCDGIIDENQPNLDDPCVEAGKQGICQGSGSFKCDTANLNGPATCVITTPGQAQQAVETCNNLDDNCNGVVDEGANTGNLLGQEWVNVPGLPGVQIMKYEASRRDSTDTFDGTTNNFACSKDDVLPWTNITYLQAKAVCDSMTNARLCTEAEWQSMCMPSVNYGTNGVPGPATANATDFTFIEAEDFLANTTIGAANRAWTRTAPLDQNGTTFMQVPDTGFSQTVAANALAQSSRLDYRLDLLASTSYNIWIRMRSPAQGAVTPVIRGSTIPTATLSPTAPGSTQVGDLVIVSTWSTATNDVVPAHTTAAGFTNVTINDVYDEGGNDNNTGRMSIAFKVADTAGAIAYPAFTSASTAIHHSGIVVIQSGTFNTATIVAASNEQTNTNAPDAPQSANVTIPTLVLAYGGWQIANVSTSVTVTAPAGFTEIWELADPSVAEFSVANATIASGTSNPAAFVDNVGPQGTIGVTLLVGAFTGGSRSVHAGLTLGTTPAAPTQVITTTVDNQTSWRVSGVFTTTTAGAYTLSLFTREDGVFIDTIAVARQSVLSPTFDNAWSYSTNPRTEQAQTCNSDDVDTDAALGGDQDDNLPTGAKAACFAEHGADDAFDMSGNVKEWTLARATDQNPLRGGAANNEAAGTTCQLNFTLADNTFFFPNTGFRCCRGP
jgi:formylglycine-generating enzyme required for sulfatase activity